MIDLALVCLCTSHWMRSTVNKPVALECQAHWVNCLIMVLFTLYFSMLQKVLTISIIGCDALNTSLGCLTWASATCLGQSWWTVGSLVASLGNFYLSTWEEYHTGILYLGYFSGPVEGVLMLVAVQLVSGYFGKSSRMA